MSSLNPMGSSIGFDGPVASEGEIDASELPSHSGYVDMNLEDRDSWIETAKKRGEETVPCIRHESAVRSSGSFNHPARVALNMNV